MVTTWDKAIVAFVMAALVVVEQIWGHSFGVSEEWVTSLIAIIGSILVYLVPNKPA